MISGGGSNLQAIMDHIEAEKLDIQISLVISNRTDAYGLKRAEKAGISTAIIDHTQFESRALFDQAMIAEIDSHEHELIVMAGFMRILSHEFVTHYAGRLINIHPSLLPAYKGLRTHQRALADSVAHHGATVHYVTLELDSGAAIVQGKVPVLEGDDEESLQSRVHRIEHIIYPTVVEWIAHGRLHCREDKVYLDDKLLEHPIIIEQASDQH
jgi:phosphoribosylglycinamide formyltransferase-1